MLIADTRAMLFVVLKRVDLLAGLSAISLWANWLRQIVLLELIQQKNPNGVLPPKEHRKKTIKKISLK